MAIKTNRTTQVLHKCPLHLVEQSLFGADSAPGWCVACGSEQDGVEPDARNYVCDACGERTVFGAEECLLNEWVED
jgi:predicted RNA-binding Zn-ribbon protein involved in translation (DUF1610 family)